MSKGPARFVFPTSTRGWIAVLAVALLLAAAMLIENGTFPQGHRLDGYVWLSVVGILVCAVLAYPLPYLGLAAALTLSIANLVVPGMPHGGGTELIMLLFMIGFFAFRLPARWSCGAWILTGVSVGVTTFVRGGEVFEIVFYLLFIAPGWFVGLLLQRERRRSAQLSALAAELAAERERGVRAATQAERSRIARELHDAVAHSVSVMTLQVGVVRRRISDRPTERETLRQAERLGRQSVDELRRIVGLVRTDGPVLAPIPSLEQLDDLISTVRTAGTRVTLIRDGDADDLGPALEVSAYRIVQEALTNAIRHAPGAAVTVLVVARPDRLTVTVRDDGPPCGPVTPGHGLTGMRERVAVFGGRLRFGPADPHGFCVEAELPTIEAAPPVAVPVGSPAAEQVR